MLRSLFHKISWVLLLGETATVMHTTAECQLNSSASTVILTGTLIEALTVVALPPAVAFNLSAGGVSTGTPSVVVATTWVLGPSRTSVKVFGYFSTSTAALTDGAGDNIPSADVLGQVTTGSPATMTAFTQTGPFGAAGASLLLVSQGITSANTTGTRSDTLNLEIQLSSTPLPAGVYTGTLRIQAQAL
jgi:hypothetical protein